MKSTREHILEILRARSQATVSELADELDIAQPALRRHLDILAAQGLVAYQPEKSGLGRPHFVYFPTEQAMELASTGYPRLVERLFGELCALAPGDEGQSLVDTVLSRLSDRMVDEYRHQVGGRSLEERIESLVTALQQEGLLSGWERRPDGYHLFNVSCPHRRAAMATPAVCASEERTIRLLLGAEVDQVGTAVRGAALCEYVIRLPQRAEPVPAGVATEQAR